MPDSPPANRGNRLADLLKRRSAEKGGKSKNTAPATPARTARVQPTGQAQQSITGAGAAYVPVGSGGTTPAYRPHQIEFGDSDSETEQLHFHTPGHVNPSADDSVLSGELEQVADVTIQPAAGQHTGAGGDDNNGGNNGNNNHNAGAVAAGQVVIMAATPVKGSEALSIPTFDGQEGLAIRQWVRSVERAIAQFNWAEEPAAAAAKQRLTDKAAFWLAQEDLKGTDLKTWARLKTALETRFFPVVTDLMATDAMKELRQRPNETGGAFLDRVWSAVHLMNVNVSLAQMQGCCKTTLKEGNQRMARHLFGSGLHQSTRDKIYQSHDPPTTLENLLKAVRNTEAETRRQAEIVSNEATDPKQHKDTTLRLVTAAAIDNQDASSEASEVDVLVEALRKFGYQKKGNCFTCGKEGHWANKCPSKGASSRRGRGKGSGGRGRGGFFQQSNGWRQQAPFSPNYGGGQNYQNRRPVNAMEAAAVAFQQFQQGQWQAPPQSDFPPIDFSPEQGAAAAAAVAPQGRITEFPNQGN